MGKKSKKNKNSNLADDKDELRNYVFYSDPLSKEDLRRQSQQPSSKRSSDPNSDITKRSDAPFAKDGSHQPNIDYTKVMEEGGHDMEEENIKTVHSENSYYARMAAEEAESVEKLPAALHNPKVRIQLASMKKYRPYFLGLCTLIQLGALIASFVLNFKATGQIIETSPFNYMIGPSSGILISMGARFVPCMRLGTGLDNMTVACPDGIHGSLGFDSQGTELCSMTDICGFNGNSMTPKPNQWYRFITAMGLHGGVVHFLMNMLFQVRTGFIMEKDFGWWRIGGVYLASGIAGFIFGANFNPLTPSVGCSGALYGLMACMLLDLLQNWQLISRPWLELFKMLLQIAISLLFGMLPFVDNLAHVGGFYTGIVSGLLLMPTVHFGKWDKWRKRILVLLALPALVIIMTFLVRGFYGSGPACPWCKYLNCIPGMPWCEEKWNPATVTTTGGP